MPIADPPFGRDLIVIGGSAGAIPVIQQVLGELPTNLPAAILVVVHQAQTTPGVLPKLFSEWGPLPAKHAEDGEAIELGRIYVAPPDRHLLVELEPGSHTLPPGVRAMKARLRLST